MSSKLESIRDLWIHAFRKGLVSTNTATTIHFVFGALVIIFNLTELIILLRRSRKTNFEIILVSLALADLISGIACLAGGICILYAFDSHGLITLLWNIIVSITTHAIMSSWCHTFIITIDRCIAVLYPFTYRILVVREKLVIILTFFWIASIATAVILIFLFDSDISAVKALSGVLIFDGIVMIVIYCLIIRKLIRNSKQLYSRSSEEQQRPNSIRCLTHHERLIAINGVAVCALFVLFNFPFTFYTITGFQDGSFFSFSAVLLHSISNPLVYFFILHCCKKHNCNSP